MKFLSLILLTFILSLTVVPVFAQTATPEPPDPVGGFYDHMSDANSKLNDAVNNPLVPNGIPNLPTDNIAMIVRYVKWIISPVGAQDLFGPFAPIFIHLGLFLTASIAFIGVYIIVYGVSKGAKLAIFLARFFMQLVSTIMEIVSAIAAAGKAAVQAGLAALGI